MSNGAHRRTNVLVKIAILAVLVLLAYVGCVLYSVSAAEKNAEKFCDEIALNSDISLAVNKAIDRKIPFDGNAGYTFYFPTAVLFDRATCGVSVDSDNRVISKHWQMEYD